MKSLIACLSIMALCFFSLCMGQTGISELQTLSLEVGATRTFELHENEDYIGYCSYTVLKRELYNGTDAYFVESTLDINSESVTLHMDSSYIVDLYGKCLHYEFEATVNGEPQTLTADFTETTVHIQGSRSNTTIDKTIEVNPKTLSMDNNMVGQWDIMFSVVPLQEGGSFGASVFAAQPMEEKVVSASVAQEKVTIEAAGKTWQCLKIEFSTPAGYTAYVTVDGHLIKMEHESGLIITLKE